MSSPTKVTASQNGAINWNEVRKHDPTSYYTFHDEDDELDTLALLRGLHNIQEAGGDGAAEQRFLDRVGFKPLAMETAAAAPSGDDAVAAGRANMTVSEAEEWARELDAAAAKVPQSPPPPPAYDAVATDDGQHMPAARLTRSPILNYTLQEAAEWAVNYNNAAGAMNTFYCAHCAENPATPAAPAPPLRARLPESPHDYTLQEAVEWATEFNNAAGALNMFYCARCAEDRTKWANAHPPPRHLLVRTLGFPIQRQVPPEQKKLPKAARKFATVKKGPPSPQSPPPPAYDAATRREVAQLTEVVADLDVPGAPPSITLPQAFVSEEAFSAHVEGRVREAVDEACAAFECERQEWARTEAAYRRELLSENRLLEAVLRKYDVSIPDARAALAELDAAEPIEPPVAHPVSPATAMSPRFPIECDASFVRFQTMATRGRRRRRRAAP